MFERNHDILELSENALRSVCDGLELAAYQYDDSKSKSVIRHFIDKLDQIKCSGFFNYLLGSLKGLSESSFKPISS